MIKHPFFYYYGGKWRCSKHYQPPKYNTIIEPFAGAAGYSLRHYQKNVILNDANPIIYSIWDYLIKTPSKEILNLPLNFDDVRELNLPQEPKWLLGFCINAATVHPCNKPSKWMRNGQRPNVFWGESMRARIAAQQEFIRHWKITNKDYRELDQTVGTWFIDPPYKCPQGEYYPNQVQSYDDLATWCEDRPGQIIVCEKEGATI